MRVAQLWRFPVKSMRGERVDAIHVGFRGLEGDRGWAVALTKHATLLSAVDALAQLLGREVAFVRADAYSRARYDLPENYATTGKGKSLRFRCPAGTFFDLGHVHLVTTSTLAALGGVDVRRLRPNALVQTFGDGFVEDEWVGRELVLGEAVRRA